MLRSLLMKKELLHGLKLRMLGQQSRKQKRLFRNMNECHELQESRFRFRSPILDQNQLLLCGYAASIMGEYSFSRPVNLGDSNCRTLCLWASTIRPLYFLFLHIQAKLAPNTPMRAKTSHAAHMKIKTYGPECAKLKLNDLNVSARKHIVLQFQPCSYA